MGKYDLESIVSKVNDIPVLPNRINRIMEITQDPDSTVQDLESEILKDQSLTSNVLKLANSTHYGYPRKINSVSRATILLGFKTIKSIALASTVSKFLLGELEGYALGEYDLWNQSQTCAIISRYIAKTKGFEQPELAYTAGLLRDIGKTILNYYVKNEYLKIIEMVQIEGKSFLEAEEIILGFNHGQIGGKVAEKWNFPRDLIEAIEYHHTPEKSKENHKLVSIVHVADAITMTMGVGLGVDGLAYEFSEHAVEELDINEGDIEQIISKTSDFILDEDSFNIV